MKKLNKYMLVVLNPRSTQEVLLKNSDGAFNAAVAVFDTAIAEAVDTAIAYDDAYDVYAAAYTTAHAAAHASAAEFKKHIDIFFELPNENIQDYHDEIKIINKDK